MRGAGPRDTIEGGVVLQLEAGDWRLEAGDWGLEAGGWGLGTR